MDKKIIGLFVGAVIFIWLVAFAVTIRAAVVPYAWIATTRNADNDANAVYFISPPSSSANGIMGWHGPSLNPIYWLLDGSTLEYNGEQIRVGTIQQSNVNGLVSALASKVSTSSLATVAFSGNYNDLTNKPTIPAAQIQSDWDQASTTALDFIKNKPSIPSGTVTSVGIISSDFSVSGSPVTSAGVITLNLNTTGTPGTYTNVTVNNKGIVTAGTTRIYNNGVSRTQNSNYTISTTRDSIISCSAPVSWTLNALLSGSASVFFEYSTTSGSTWAPITNVGKQLSILSTGGQDDMNFSGSVPANVLTRIRTTSSNMTIGSIFCQETYQ